MNILLITSYFPSLDIEIDSPRTKFLYYYALEWVKQGCEVLVLHSVPRYPRLFSQGVYLLEKRLCYNNLQLSGFLQKPEVVQAADYQIDGIKVIRRPIKKILPHRNFLPWSLSCHKKKVVQLFKESAFKADIIISDFLTPSAYIAYDIKQRFNIPFYQVLHISDFNYLKKYKKLKKIINKASGILFRSQSLVSLFKEEGLVAAYEDYIFSGIPNDIQVGKPRTEIKKLLFVGSLILRKKVDIIFKAIAESKSCKYFELEIVGDGPCAEDLKALSNRLGIAEQVKFSGRLSRKEVFEKMRHADCLVMVSIDTFGMVYIEALSQGCIVIAAKNQGIDGIIVNGENGFLVKHGDVGELAELFQRLTRIDRKEIMKISKNALQTVLNMNDGDLASSLLNRLSTHIKQNKRNLDRVSNNNPET